MDHKQLMEGALTTFCLLTERDLFTPVQSFF